jgi:hypothetical protein
MNKFEWKNSILGKEFDQYVLDHPAFAQKIPRKAVIALQLEGDEEFNKWSRQLAEEQAEEGQPIIYVNIKRLREPRSRIEELEVEQVA